MWHGPWPSDHRRRWDWADRPTDRLCPCPRPTDPADVTCASSQLAAAQSWLFTCVQCRWDRCRWQGPVFPGAGARPRRGRTPCPTSAIRQPAPTARPPAGKANDLSDFRVFFPFHPVCPSFFPGVPRWVCTAAANGTGRQPDLNDLWDERVGLAPRSRDANRGLVGDGRWGARRRLLIGSDVVISLTRLSGVGLCSRCSGPRYHRRSTAHGLQQHIPE